MAPLEKLHSPITQPPLQNQHFLTFLLDFFPKNLTPLFFWRKGLPKPEPVWCSKINFLYVFVEDEPFHLRTDLTKSYLREELYLVL